MAGRAGFRLRVLRGHGRGSSVVRTDDASTAPTVVQTDASARRAAAARFDPKHLARQLNMHDHELRQRVIDVVTQPGHVNPAFPLPLFRPDMSVKLLRRQTLCQVRALLSAGLLAPDDVSRHVLGLVAVAETASCWDSSFGMKIMIQLVLFGASLAQLATPEQATPLLPDIVAMRVAGCFAMSEIAHGSNVAALETRAEYQFQDDTWRLSTPEPRAEKCWVGQGVSASHALVFARLILRDVDHGVHAFLVPLRDLATGRLLPGITVLDHGRKGGLNGVDHARISFASVTLPRTALLARHASVDVGGVYVTHYKKANQRFTAMLGALVLSRLVTTCCANVGAGVSLTIALRYLHQRTQFGPTGRPETPIIEYRTVQLRLFPLLAAVYAERIALARLKTQIGAAYTGKGTLTQVKDLHTMTAGVKAIATWTAVQTHQACRECCGGHGYAAVNRIVDMRAAADAMCTLQGDNPVMLQQVTRLLLGVFKRRVARGPGAVNVYSRQMREAMLENSRTSISRLHDRRFLLQTMSYREQRLVFALARRLRQRVTHASVSPLQAWNECLDHVNALAMAHVQVACLRHFWTFIDSCPSDQAAALVPLARLYGLWHIYQDAEWYLVHSYLTPRKVQAIRKLIHSVCRDLASSALPLVDALDAAWSLEGVPLAQKDYVAAMDADRVSLAAVTEQQVRDMLWI